jgi:SCP-2 sterol transfer family protein
LNGFLAGILLPLDPHRAEDLNATYRIHIDGRRFEFAVRDNNLAAAQTEPDVTVTATASDLIRARVGATAAERKAALRRVKFDGDPHDIEAMRTAFVLEADPKLAVPA